jgi:methylphosphotriester-DNA--protein-cysteine methyltransferase
MYSFCLQPTNIQFYNQLTKPTTRHSLSTLQPPNEILLEKHFSLPPVFIHFEVYSFEAKNLLKSGLYKNYEICEAIGYKDYNHFSKIFKKQFGYSPSDYRKLILSN